MSILNLCHDNFYEIAQYLDVEDILALSFTCKDIQNHLSDERIKKHIKSFPFASSLHKRANTIIEGATFTNFFKNFGTKKIELKFPLNELSYLKQCELCDIIRLYKEPIPNDIQPLLDSGKHHIPKLENYIKARDTIIIWKEITRSNNGLLPFEPDNKFWSQSELVIQQANEFQSWCEKNKDYLATVTELNLSRNALVHIDAIAPLINLQGINLAHNRIIDKTTLSKLQNITAFDITYNRINDYLKNI